MALEVYYQTGGTAYSEIGTAVQWGTLGLTQSAELGEAAISSISIDDLSGTGDYVGLRAFYVSETAEGTPDRTIWHGYTADQRIGRSGAGDDVALYGSARKWDVTLVDDNASLGFRVLRGTAADRPAESGSARLAWVLTEGSAYIANDGLVAYPGTSVQMDANDYAGQYLKDVLDDLALASGYNYWAQWNGSTSRVQLFFDDSVTSTAFASSLKISNVAADIDGTAILAPDMGATLYRDPSRIAAGVYLPYAKGALYDYRQATVDAFGFRDQVAPTSNVRTASGATAVLTRLLDTMDEQEERVTCRVWVKTSQVNDIKAGHRIQAKFAHFPQWEDYRWCRVVRRTIANYDTSLGLYELTLELIPQTNRFEGTAFMALLRVENESTFPVYTTVGDTTPAGGWYLEPTVSSVFTALESPGGGQYVGVRTSRNIIVRIEAYARYAYTGSGNQTITFSILKNGGTIGSDSDNSTGGLRFVSGALGVDLRDVELAAGDEIKVTGARADSGDPGWDNLNANIYWFRIGRGTVTMNSGATTWTGP